MPVKKIIKTCRSSYQSECTHSNSDVINKLQCARVAGNDAKCYFCTGRVPEGTYVILFPCGHWVERNCYNSRQAAGVQVKCRHECSKDSRDFRRSSDLMSEDVRAQNELTSNMMSNVQQHDVAEHELMDVEDLLERDEELANTKHSRPPRAPSFSDIDTMYEGDIEDAGGSHDATSAKNRSRIMKSGVNEIFTAEEQPQAVEEQEPSHFFPPVPEDEDDFGLNSGLTLSQRMFNLPRSRRFL